MLLVLDDIEADQAEALLDVEALAPGSVIIATSRLRDVLEEVGCAPVVLVETLSPRASRELFMHHAERKQRVPAVVGSALVTEAISICGGLPLSLEVRSSSSPRCQFIG